MNAVLDAGRIADLNGALLSDSAAQKGVLALLAIYRRVADVAGPAGARGQARVTSAVAGLVAAGAAIFSRSDLACWTSRASSLNAIL